MLPPGLLVADRFEVVREIGRGGFGRVYEARDRVLSRPVALKFLIRRRRLTARELQLFYREAQATARLNHAHVVTAHDWGEWRGVPFLVLELLEGESLVARLARGPLPEQSAWAIARDVARALVYAHGQGVLHLDLKSQNVFLLADGRTKVLDFGLAGLEWSGEDVPGGVARVRGGTPATMAPEQAAGGATDARTDVWAVGVMLHEMLFGRLPDRRPEGAAAAPLPSAAPRRARDLLRRTLAREPGARFPDAGSLLAALEERARPRPTRRARWVIATAAVAAAAGAAVIATRARSTSPAAAVVVPPAASQHRQLTFSGDVSQAELSPSGDAFLYITNRGRELWVRAVDSDQPRRIFVGEGLASPRWFPDGRRIFLTVRPRPTRAWVVRRDGGEAREVPFRRQYTVVLADGATVGSISRGRPDPQEIELGPLDGGPGTNVPLPDGLNILVDIDVTSKGRFLVQAWNGHGQLWSVGRGSPARLLYSTDQRVSGARWQGDGDGVFFVQTDLSDTSLRWLPLADRSGDGAVTLFSGVSIGGAVSPSRDGRRLLYLRQTSAENLVRLEPGGRLTPLTRGTADLSLPGVSPDGRTVAYVVREDRTFSIAVGPIEPEAARARFPGCPRGCSSPVWSPDGDRIAITREEQGGTRIVTMAPDGTDERVLDRSRPTDNEITCLEWLSRSEIVYMPRLHRALRVIDLETGEDRPFLPGPAPGWMFKPKVSPDGRRVSFFWSTGQVESSGLYLADRSGRGARRVSGLGWPIAWTDDGTAIVVATLDVERSVDALERVDLESGARTALWRSTGDFKVAEAVAVPRSGDFILVQDANRSDAWLIEDPLGGAATRH